MDLFVNIKQLGEGKPPAPVPFNIEGEPRTAGELIEAVVKVCVAEFNKRVRQGDTSPRPLTKQQIKDMADVGKIAFGFVNSPKEQEEVKAAANALQSFEDGLFRLFLGDAELSSPDEVIELRDGDVLTFIRLTMLAGRMY